MNWKSNIRTHEEEKVITRRRFFCWIPRIGSDRRWHWLETITRWEKNDGYPLDENTGKVIYVTLGELGTVSFKLIEGPEQYRL